MSTVHGEEHSVDRHAWMLLLKRPHRRNFWRAAFGAIFLLMLVGGGFHSRPQWISNVADAFLFVTALWLLFSAGLRFGHSTAYQERTGAAGHDAKSGF